MKHIKRLTALALALVMVFSLTTGASAAGAENVKVQLSPNITVTYNGEAQTMADVNGNPVYPILNGGTTYLPIRAVGNMLGLDVDWDGATQTVLLNKSADGKAPAKSDNASASDSAPTEITAQINPGITVKYNGKAQNMADVNGNPVYPMLYGGTTYLPVRAVSNMLGIDVDWDGATQTVILTEPKANDTNTAQTPIRTPDASADGVSMIATDRNGKEVTVRIPYNSTQEEIVAILTAANVDEELAKVMAGSHRFTSPEEYDKINHVAEMKTSTDAKILGENHIGYDWCEIDWSNAEDGYFRVKINEQITHHTDCVVRWYEDETSIEGERHNKSDRYTVPVGKWVNIPLINGNDDGSTDYAVTFESIQHPDEIAALNEALANAKTEEAVQKVLDTYVPTTLTACFTGHIISEDERWLLSTMDINFENAPLTCAKALEITKNCKTDAEKVTAVFNWVASNIQYNHKLSDEIIAWGIEKNARKVAGNFNPVYDWFQDGARMYLDLDKILTSKSGVCEDYATLMVGMLRSLGIPCKLVVGDMYDGKIINGYNDDNPGWVSHAWVAVSPDTEGLNLSALGAGHEADGWIRLDPTNASYKTLTSNDKNYRTTDYY